MARLADARSLDDLAAHAGFSRTHINHMELNTYTGGREAWAAVAGALELSLDYLLFGQAATLPESGQEGAHPQDEQLLLLRDIWPLLEVAERRAVMTVAETFAAAHRKAQ